MRYKLISTALFGIILALLLLVGNRTSWGVILSGLLFLTYLALRIKVGAEAVYKYFIYVLIISIPFPLCLFQFAGKDALNATTIGIYLFFAAMMLDALFERKMINVEPKYAFVLPFMIIISLTLSLICNPLFIGQSFKFYIANVSGILLYFIIITTLKKPSETVMIIKTILILLIVQSVVVLLEWKYPIVAKYLIPFGREIVNPQAYVVEGVLRVKGTILDYELLAEWFLLGSFLSIGLVYYLKNNFYFFPLLCCIMGISFTATRSVIFLLVAGLVAVFALLAAFKKEYKLTSLKIIFWLILSSLLLLALFPRQVDKFANRFTMYFQHGLLLSPEAINRKATWEMAINTFRSGPALFGNGLYDVGSRYSWAGSFHSLYMTLLYKIGIFGLAIYFIFWVKMLQHSWHILNVEKHRKDWHVVLFLFISVIIMLIDEIKVEYLRYQHTIQFAWVIYALLISSLKQGKNINENIMVS